ncbi:M56 family metallopeptidase [Candidatus Woesearchaeota archaeon]|nr:M56 family metallopeptidase [Candidatus Woesearchaeota archaeon]
MMCSECALGFFFDPVKIGIIAVSLFVAILSLCMVLRRDLPVQRRVYFVYLHVAALVFPFVYYLLFSGCSALASGCSRFLPTVYLIGLTGVISALVGSVAAPLIFLYGKSRSASALQDTRLLGFLEAECRALAIRVPKVLVVDTARPVAFSFSGLRPVIFLSAGLLDLLDRKESEAVLLHELMHIRQGSSLLRFSSFFMRLFSPLAGFASLRHELNNDEAAADTFAILRQGTDVHILSAKQKVNGYFEFSEAS